MRKQITMACTGCQERNYTTWKNKKTHTERLELRKFCRRCRTVVVHKETK